MKHNLKYLTIAAILFGSVLAVHSQNIPVIKYFDQDTVDLIKIDYDNDGDDDLIIAGVISDKRQGRIYLVESKNSQYLKPEYIYSYPTIPIKQALDVKLEDETTTITITGTSPTDEKVDYIGTLIKGKFEGLILSPKSIKF